MKLLYSVPVLLAVALLFATPSRAAAQSNDQVKIAFVDFEKILSEMPEFAVIQKKLVSLRESVRDSLAAMQNDLQTKVDNYRKQQEMMTPQARQTEEQKLQQQQQEMVDFQQSRSTMLQNAQDSLVAPVRERISAAVSKIAERQKLSAVFDKAIPFYYDKKLDITFQVLDYLNRESK